jgi:hypothetical protein
MGFELPIAHRRVTFVVDRLEVPPAVRSAVKSRNEAKGVSPCGRRAGAFVDVGKWPASARDFWEDLEAKATLTTPGHKVKRA